MPITQDDLRHALESIGTEDGETDKIAPPVVAKLIELRFVEIDSTGLPRLTDNGEHAFVVLESGDGNVPELNDYPPAGM